MHTKMFLQSKFRFLLQWLSQILDVLDLILKCQYCRFTHYFVHLHWRTLNIWNNQISTVWAHLKDLPFSFVQLVFKMGCRNNAKYASLSSHLFIWKIPISLPWLQINLSKFEEKIDQHIRRPFSRRPTAPFQLIWRGRGPCMATGQGPWTDRQTRLETILFRTGLNNRLLVVTFQQTN